jgi:teichuronic acid biosynthesis glycosyltransferase TuaG
VISVITPAFNAAATLQASIDSVRAQSFGEWEMLIVDDGSKDSTARIASQAAQADKRIRLIMQQNQGVASARNCALDMCSYPFVAFLDADDVWLPDKLERQLTFMSTSRSAFTFTAYRKLCGDVVGPKVTVPHDVDYVTLLKSRPIMCSSVMIDRKAIDVRMPAIAARSGVHEDLATWLAILRSGVVARGLDRDLLLLRKGHDSRSSNKAKAALNVWHVYREHERLSVLRAAWYFSHYAFNSIASGI